MSSSEDDVDAHTDHAPRAKKRRLPRACDACRKKKTKCNSAEMPNNFCTNCITAGIECLHTIPHKKRGVNKELLHALERKVAAHQALLRKLYPDRDFTQELEDLEHQKLTESPSSSQRANSSPPPSKAFLPTMGPSDPLSYLHEGTSVMQEGEEVDEKIAELNNVESRMHDMHIETVKTRWFGSSSNFALFSQAAEMKESYEGGRSSKMSSGQFKRPAYWKLAPYIDALRHSDPEKTLLFPPQDLLDHLVTMYLLRINSFFPILHTTTFRKSIKDGLHHHDHSFGRLLSMVCAVGSRFSDDPRVFYDHQNPLSAGFQWFEQVKILSTKYLLETMSLLDVQTLCVALLYFLGTGIPQGTWFTLGFAIRTCQERGVHHRLPGSKGRATKTFQDELWKRAWWFLVSMDRQLTNFLGRPSAIGSEDIEIDYPEECDDEYWIIDGEDVTFNQPHDKPSLVTAFCVHLKLCELYAVSMRTLYASPRSRALFGVTGDNWESRIVTELDSSLNSWLDSIPDHLRWDPQREDPIHFDQSCLIYTIFYGLQITIHRPFINKKQSMLAFPSLALCTNSARSCSHVLEAQVRRGSMRLPHAQMTAYSASFVLLLNIYGAKKFEISLDSTKEMSAVYMLIRFMKACDSRWTLSGRFADVITELASVHTPLPQAPETTLKRGRDEASEISQQPQINGIDRSHSESYSSGMTGYPDTSYNWNYHQYPAQQIDVAPAEEYPGSAYTQPMLQHVTAYPNGSADWNISPYALPSLPSDAYPGFYVDPNMAQTNLGVQELEQLSHQMSGFSSMPTNMAGPGWQQFLGNMAASPVGQYS